MDSMGTGCNHPIGGDGDTPMGGVLKIPNSARRKAPGVFAKLLRRVRNPPRSGFDFEGMFLKPGVVIEEAELHPSPEWPSNPVLLECAGIAKTGRGHHRSELLYILWQYDGREWLELGRAISSSWDWAADLATLAVRAIGGRPVDLEAVAKRIEAAIRKELDELPEDIRAMVAGTVHDALATAIVGEGGANKHPGPDCLFAFAREERIISCNGYETETRPRKALHLRRPACLGDAAARVHL